MVVTTIAVGLLSWLAGPVAPPMLGAGAARCTPQQPGLLRGNELLDPLLLLLAALLADLIFFYSLAPLRSQNLQQHNRSNLADFNYCFQKKICSSLFFFLAEATSNSGKRNEKTTKFILL